MYSPTTRVLTVLELLQAHGPMSGPDLAQRLDVDARTLRRYIAKLGDMGIPVVTERGRYGHYSLAAGYKLPPMMFTDHEAAALSVGLLAARRLGLAALAVESAQAKLERVMPAHLKQRVRALGSTVVLGAQRQARTLDSATLLALSTAAHSCQRVQLCYAAAQGVASARQFDPYGLACRGDRWYAVGHCHLRGGLRSFRLDRVQSVTPLDAYFIPPVDFDTAGQLALGVATLPRAQSAQVLLKTDLHTARGALFDSIGLLQPCAGGVLLHSQVDDLNWLALELARLPFDFEVQRPAGLRVALRRVARRLLTLAERPTTAKARSKRA